MAQLVIAAAGAAVGFAVGGSTGAQWGWIAGSTLGSLLDPPSGVGPRLGDLSVTSSAYGSTIPYVEGHLRLAGQVIWASEKRELETTTREGKGGAQYTSYSYEVDLHILLTENQIVDVTRIWSNGKLIWTRLQGATEQSLNASDNTSRWSRLTVYTGEPDQLPDPEGHPNAPAYRGRGSVFIKDFGLGASGALPNLTFEVTTEGVVGGAPGGVLVQQSGSLAKLNYESGALIETYPLIVNGVSYIDDYLQQSGEPIPNSNKVALLGTDNFPADPNAAVVVYEFDVPSGSYTRRIGNLPGSIGLWMRASPDGQYLYTLSNESNDITRIRLSDGAITTAATVQGYTFSNAYFDRFEISPDGSKLVIAVQIQSEVPGVSNGILQFFNASSGALLHTVTLGVITDDCTYLKYNSLGSRLHVSWENLFVIDTTSYVVLHNLTPSFVGGQNTPGAIAFNQDESLMYMGYAFYGKIDYYSLPSYTYIKTVNIANLPNSELACFLSMTWSPDYKRLYVGDWNLDNVWCYDIETEEKTNFFYSPTFYSMPPIIAGGSNTTSFIDPTLRSVVQRLCLRAGMPSSEFDVSALPTTPVRGLAISQISSTRSVLELLERTYFFESKLSDKLYFFPRQTSPVGSISYEDMGAVDAGAQAEEVLPLRLQDELEIPAQVALTYINEAADYASDTQYSDRLISSQINTAALQVPINFSSTQAKAIADALLQDRILQALSTSISVTLKHSQYEPGDVLSLKNEQEQPLVMRIVKKTESGITIRYDLVRDEASVLSQSGSTSTPNTTQTEVSPVAATQLTLLNLPPLVDNDTDSPGFYVTVGKVGAGDWSGAEVQSSITGADWTPVGTFTNQTVRGTTSSTLGAWTFGDTVDFMNELVVNVGSNNALAGVSRDSFLADQSLNLAWVGTINSLNGETNGELLRFQNASLISAGVYRLRGLHRGLGNTASSMNHAAGENFVLLKNARFEGVLISDIGQQRLYRAVTLGSKPVGLSTQPFAVNATNLKPFAPVDLRVNRTGSDTVLTWVRSTRLSTRFAGPIPVAAQLGESTESYRVTVYGSTFDPPQIKRSVLVNSPTWTYTLAMQLEDFGGAQSSLRIRVAQLSSVIGDGHPLDQVL